MAVAEKKFVLPNLMSINRLPISKIRRFGYSYDCLRCPRESMPRYYWPQRIVRIWLYQAFTLEQRMRVRSAIRSGMVDVSSHALRKEP